MLIVFQQKLSHLYRVQDTLQVHHMCSCFYHAYAWIQFQSIIRFVLQHSITVLMAQDLVGYCENTAHIGESLMRILKY